MLYVKPSLNGSPGSDYVVGPSIGGLYDAIVQEHTGNQTATYDGKVNHADIDVYRQGVALGNLVEIRQAFHLWTEEFDLWAVKSGNFHLRKPRHVPASAVHHLTWDGGLWEEKLPDGTIRTCANQLRFRVCTRAPCDRLSGLSPG